jgi:hypothetical protein
MGSALLFKVLLSVGLMGLHVQPATTPPPSLVKEAPSEAIANCNIFASFNGNIFCYDNGTPNDPTDDTFTTEVVVSGTMFGNNGWTATDPLSSSGPYDQVVVLGPYLIANGPFPITFQDVDDPTCTSITVTIHDLLLLVRPLPATWKWSAGVFFVTATGPLETLLTTSSPKTSW